MINDKDLNAIAQIIKGVLSNTRWIGPITNSLAEYFAGEYSLDMSKFRGTCLNGNLFDKEPSQASIPIESKVKRDTDCGPTLSIAHHLKAADEATNRLSEVLGKRKIK